MGYAGQSSTLLIACVSLMISMLGSLIIFVWPGFASLGLTVAGPNVTILFQKHICDFLCGNPSCGMFKYVNPELVSVTGTEHV